MFPSCGVLSPSSLRDVMKKEEERTHAGRLTPPPPPAPICPPLSPILSVKKEEENGQANLQPVSAFTQAFNDQSFFEEVMAMVDKYSKENTLLEPAAQQKVMSVQQPRKSSALPAVIPLKMEKCISPCPTPSLPRFIQNQMV